MSTKLDRLACGSDRAYTRARARARVPPQAPQAPQAPQTQLQAVLLLHAVTGIVLRL